MDFYGVWVQACLKILYETHISACKHSSTKRRIRNDCYAKFSAGFQQPDLLILYVKRKGRVFHLNSRDRMDGIGATKSLSRHLWETEVSYFPLSGKNKISHITNVSGGTHFTSSAIAPTVFWTQMLVNKNYQKFEQYLNRDLRIRSLKALLVQPRHAQRQNPKNPREDNINQYNQLQVF